VSVPSMGQRPGTVTFVAFLTWLVAILDLLAGGVLLWASYNLDGVDTTLSEGDLRLYGLVTLAFGLLTAAVASGLNRGSQLARVIVIAVMALRLVVGGLVLISLGDLASWPAIIDLAISLVVILILTTRRASAFFRGFRG